MGLASSALARATESGTVSVTVTYKGKGAVDASHRIWVWVFDSPDIGAGSFPLGETSVDKNGGVASFPGLTVEKVWIAVAYDEAGGFAGSAPPTTGMPVMLYGAEKGAPLGVTPGDGGKVSLVFDDSRRMP
jgi:hypothetical protein